jgi:glucose/arabinose dehydrogenase
MLSLLPGAAGGLLLRGAVLVALLLGGLTRCARPPQPPSIIVPEGFQDTLVREVGGIATALALLPDDRMLTTTREGQIWVHDPRDSASQAGLVLDMEAQSLVCVDDERGLLGLAVDPEFATTRHFFVYYSFRNGHTSNTCPVIEDSVARNRVVRYTLNPEDKAVDPVIVLDNIPSPCGSHNAGDVQFGPRDGLLYIATGDGGVQCGSGNIRARYTSNLAGKILRIQKDGSIPADNPFANVPGAIVCSELPVQVLNTTTPCKEIFAWGLRNPFRIVFKPDSDEFYINDVGHNLWEEISIGGKGKDYGWPCFEGTQVYATGMAECPPDTTLEDVKPIHEYPHAIGRGAVTGGAFVIGSNWPAPYEGAYYFGDTCCGNVFRLVQDGDAYTDTVFTKRPGYLVDMLFDPKTSSLYYTTGGEGAIRAITYVGAGAVTQP